MGMEKLFVSICEHVLMMSIYIFSTDSDSCTFKMVI